MGKALDAVHELQEKIMEVCEKHGVSWVLVVDSTEGEDEMIVFSPFESAGEKRLVLEEALEVMQYGPDRVEEVIPKKEQH